MKINIVALYKSFLVITLLSISLSSCGWFSSSSNVPVYPSHPTGVWPLGIAIDSSGRIWITNGDDTITTLLPNGIQGGKYYAGSNLWWGIAINASGNVWVVNNGDGTVTEIGPKGKIIGTYKVGPVIGSYPFEIKPFPECIAIDASGNVWITNSGSDNVVKLSSTGITIGTYQVGFMPRHIAIDPFGNVWVVNNGSITELNSQGITIGTYSVKGYAIAIDASRNVWVTSGNSVMKLSPTGSIIGTYPVGSNSSGIAIDASDNVWVVNNGDDTVTELNPTGKTIGIYPVGIDPTSIAIDTSGNVWVINTGSNSVTEISGIAKGPQYWPYKGPQWP